MWTNQKNNKKYIGVTKRATLQKRAGRNGQNYRGSPYFYSAIQKYGMDSFKGQILQQCLSKIEAQKKQKEYITKYNTLDSRFGYNLHEGGFPSVQIDETPRREKISNTLKKQRASAQYRDIMSKRMLKVWRDPQRKQQLLNKRKGKKSGRKEVPIYCIQKAQLYENLHVASKALNIDVSNLSVHIKKGSQTFVIGKRKGTPYTIKVVHNKESELPKNLNGISA